MLMVRVDSLGEEVDILNFAESGAFGNHDQTLIEEITILLQSSLQSGFFQCPSSRNLFLVSWNLTLSGLIQ